MSLCRVLLVDDRPEVLKSLERFLALYPEIKVVGRVLSGREALEQVAVLHPDLVLMDLVMPDVDGLEATRHIKAQGGGVRVILMTVYDYAAARAAAEAAGADGFISKADLGTQLLPLIRTLLP